MVSGGMVWNRRRRPFSMMSEATWSPRASKAEERSIPRTCRAWTDGSQVPSENVCLYHVRAWVLEEESVWPEGNLLQGQDASEKPKT